MNIDETNKENNGAHCLILNIPNKSNKKKRILEDIGNNIDHNVSDKKRGKSYDNKIIKRGRPKGSKNKKRKSKAQRFHTRPIRTTTTGNCHISAPRRQEIRVQKYRENEKFKRMVQKEAKYLISCGLIQKRSNDRRGIIRICIK